MLSVTVVDLSSDHHVVGHRDVGHDEDMGEGVSGPSGTLTPRYLESFKDSRPSSQSMNPRHRHPRITPSHWYHCPHIDVFRHHFPRIDIASASLSSNRHHIGIIVFASTSLRHYMTSTSYHTGSHLHLCQRSVPHRHCSGSLSTPSAS